jgi:hypothetical protein
LGEYVKTPQSLTSAGFAKVLDHPTAVFRLNAFQRATQTLLDFAVLVIWLPIAVAEFCMRNRPLAKVL